MFKYEPVTHYELKFDKNPMPLYVYYTLLGQEYEVMRHEPDLLTSRGVDADYALDVLETALNGYPRRDGNEFHVRYCDGMETKMARVFFYIDEDTGDLSCSIQRGHYADNSTENTTHIEYEPSYRTHWSLDDLMFYDFIPEEDVEEDY